jgi:6-pyruvoyltetrahydropterin/6-carboxytetrahydropterin synthase
MITATRYHDISCGHRVYGHESKCANLHGHNYRVTFTVGGDLDSLGRVLDFSVIKSRLCIWLEDNWDHKFILWEQDPAVSTLQTLDPTVITVPFNPTAENLGQFLLDVVGPAQLAGTGCELLVVDIEETRKCSATVRKT